jgi:hypothetical protein
MTRLQLSECQRLILWCHALLSKTELFLLKDCSIQSETFCTHHISCSLWSSTLLIVTVCSWYLPTLLLAFQVALSSHCISTISTLCHCIQIDNTDVHWTSYSSTVTICYHIGSVLNSQIISGNEGRLFIYYTSNISCGKCVKWKFHRKYSCGLVPCKAAICKIVIKV